jgi:hypothetical protein
MTLRFQFCVIVSMILNAGAAWIFLYKHPVVDGQSAWRYVLALASWQLWVWAFSITFAAKFAALVIGNDLTIRLCSVL